MNISQRLRTCAKHTALDAVIELLNEAADEIDALHDRANWQATQPAEVNDDVSLDEQFHDWIGTIKDAHDESLHDEHESSRSMLRGVIYEMEEARTTISMRSAQVPMTDEQVDAFTVNGRLHWLGKRQLIRAVEAYYGITAQAKKETP